MSRYRPCEATEGEWGQPCPSCGALLPARPKPLTSWQAARNRDEAKADLARLAAPAALRVKNQPRVRDHHSIRRVA